MIENIKKEAERCLLVGVDTGEYDCDYSMNELCALTESAESEVVACMVQHMPKINNATMVGAGKLEEIRSFCKINDVNLIIFNDELSGSQAKNIEDAAGVRVIDRTTLILDIFARRAITSEGKLQVHLAQLKYKLPRLTGSSAALSRLGGGIGTRGPGESKLESDKRYIRARISSLEAQLSELEKRRDILRRSRKKNSMSVVSLVGYTNVGKSSLLNALSGARVLCADKLFATLDPTARSVTLDNGQEVIFVDTVGFVSRLPHSLVEAFKSTLEEAVESDVILNVCDISSEYCKRQLEVSRGLLLELGCAPKKIITVYNKCDRLAEPRAVVKEPDSFTVSASTGYGFSQLISEIKKRICDTISIKALVPFDSLALLTPLRQGGTFTREEYTENGVLLEGHIKKSRLHLIEKYLPRG